MKNIILILFIGLFMPFGGKVISIITPGIVCPGEGPITIRPVGIYPTTMYATLPVGTSRYAYKVITPGSWILGLYSTAPVPICGTTTIPPVPVPVIPIQAFGTSLPSF